MAKMKFPGIYLAAGPEVRRERIESLARTIRAAADQPRDLTGMRSAVLERYGWSGLATTIGEAYRAAQEVFR